MSVQRGKWRIQERPTISFATAKFITSCFADVVIYRCILSKKDDEWREATKLALSYSSFASST
ncbi:MAG: hypothetical protein GY822_25480 [Deltaproteobacteria bacterium]|nr:hypothetical protein [Deltaproteobacteria bacterium]